MQWSCYALPLNPNGWGGGGREAVTHPRPGSTLDYGIQLTEGRYWGVRMYKPPITNGSNVQYSNNEWFECTNLVKVGAGPAVW